MTKKHEKFCESALTVLGQYVGSIVASSLLDVAFKTMGKDREAELSESDCQKIVLLLGDGLGVWVKNNGVHRACYQRLQGCVGEAFGGDSQTPPSRRPCLVKKLFSG